MNSVKIFTAGSNDDLALKICGLLGRPIGKAVVDKFPDGETRVEIQDNVRGSDCFVIQSTGPPVNDNIMQLLVLIDALRRSSPKRITAVVPYFGYSRQDSVFLSFLVISTARKARSKRAHYCQSMS
jgi:ribose-phosphate pyrophosphokinase